MVMTAEIDVICAECDKELEATEHVNTFNNVHSLMISPCPYCSVPKRDRRRSSGDDA